MLRRSPVLFLLLLLLGATGAAQNQSDPYRLLLFSAPEQRVAAVGEAFVFRVEGLAVPETDEDAAALVEAFRRLAFPAEIQDDFDVIRADDATARRRAGTRIFELERRFVLHPRRAGALTIPSVPVVLEQAEFTTRPQRIRAYEADAAFGDAARAVVPLVAEGRRGGQELRRIGSGFFIAEDALVTAYHVVLDAEAVRLHLPDGRTVTTRRAWAIDPARDVAVLHVDPGAVRRAAITPLRLAPRFDPDLMGDDEVGVAFTAGWPDGMQQTTAGRRYRSLRFGPADLLRVTANAVRPGDSGGPLLDRHGRVLGVVSSGRSTRGEPDVLREDLCLATDPRRALAARLAEERPSGLRRLLRETAARAPNAEVLQTASLLFAPRLRPDATEALDRVGAAARRAPQDVALQFLAGSVFQAYGDDERAAQAYRAALDGFDDYFPALYALGHVHLERGEYDQAAALFTRTRAFAPYARLGALGLARIHTARLNYTAAAEALADVLERDPHYAPALYLLGYGLVAEGYRAQAEALAIRLDRLAPAWADALRLHLSHELLRPAVLEALPRAALQAAR